jgi:hypothetical protein
MSFLNEEKKGGLISQVYLPPLPRVLTATRSMMMLRNPAPVIAAEVSSPLIAEERVRAAMATIMSRRMT